MNEESRYRGDEFFQLEDKLGIRFSRETGRDLPIQLFDLEYCFYYFYGKDLKDYSGFTGLYCYFPISDTIDNGILSKKPVYMGSTSDFKNVELPQEVQEYLSANKNVKLFIALQEIPKTLEGRIKLLSEHARITPPLFPPRLLGKDL